MRNFKNIPMLVLLMAVLFYAFFIATRALDDNLAKKENSIAEAEIKVEVLKDATDIFNGYITQNKNKLLADSVKINIELMNSRMEGIVIYSMDTFDVKGKLNPKTIFYKKTSNNLFEKLVFDGFFDSIKDFEIAKPIKSDKLYSAEHLIKSRLSFENEIPWYGLSIARKKTFNGNDLYKALTELYRVDPIELGNKFRRLSSKEIREKKRIFIDVMADLMAKNMAYEGYVDMTIRKELKNAKVKLGTVRGD